MITCPRCGGQAPDGTPWCPYCGYGKPENPAPAPQPEPKKKKKKKSLLRKILLTIGIIFGVLLAGFIALAIQFSKKYNPPTTTPNMETMVQKAMDQSGTEAALSATPISTVTPSPTNTPIPTATMVPTSTVLVRGSVEEPTKACLIKGNVNDKGEKFYHCPNGHSYNTVKIKLSDGDRWFCTEEEAIAAGFQHPANDPACQY